MQLLEVSCAVRPMYGSLGTKGLSCTTILTRNGNTLVRNNLSFLSPVVPKYGLLEELLQ
jgi:hypothetical protein